MTVLPTETSWVSVHCPVCGPEADSSRCFTARNVRYGIDVESTVVACATCGLKRTDPQPDETLMAKLYTAGQYYTHQGSDAGTAILARAKAKVTLAARRQMVRGPIAALRSRVEARTGISRFTRRFAIEQFRLERGQTLLDIGCGSGQTLELLMSYGVDVIGVEPDPEARKASESRGIYVADSLEHCPTGVDRAILRHVLEHVDEPVALLTEVRDHLTPDGRMLIAVPNAESDQAEAFGHYWEGWDLPRHRWHFTATTLTDVCTRAGLAVEHLRSVELDSFAVASHAHRRQQDAAPVSYNPTKVPELEVAMKGAELVAIVTPMAPNAAGQDASRGQA